MGHWRIVLGKGCSWHLQAVCWVAEATILRDELAVLLQSIPWRVVAADWALVSRELDDVLLRAGVASSGVHSVGLTAEASAGFGVIMVEHAALAKAGLQGHRLLHIDLAEVVAQNGIALGLLMILRW